MFNMADDDRITRAEPRNHNDEQKKIEGQLAELVPESLLDITCLLDSRLTGSGNTAAWLMAPKSTC